MLNGFLNMEIDVNCVMIIEKMSIFLRSDLVLLIIKMLYFKIKYQISNTTSNIFILNIKFKFTLPFINAENKSNVNDSLS